VLLRAFSPELPQGHDPGALVQARLLVRLLRERGRLREVVLGLLTRGERGRALACPCEEIARALLDLRRVGIVRGCLVRRQVMRGEHLDDLLLGGERLLDLRCGGEMAGLALALRERLVGDTTHEVLEEAVLPVLGRAWIGLDREHLLAHQAGEQHSELVVREAGQASDRLLRERLPEHGGVLEQAPLIGGEPVEASRDQGLQRLGHLERLDRPHRPVHASLLNEQPPVEQHAHRLDCVQRHALGARQDPPSDLRRQSGDEAREQLLHRLLGERLEVKPTEHTLPGAPLRPPLEQLRPRERDHVERVVP
jgi:hypothetical protein